MFELHQAIDETPKAYIREGMTDLEELQARELREAQNRSVHLFHEVEARGLIRPGIAEGQFNDEIYALAQEMLGTTTYWHKRIFTSWKEKQIGGFYEELLTVD